MNVQDVIADSRLLHVRELKTLVASLREENRNLRDELNSLKAHFDLALICAVEMKDGEALEIWDGWNLVLGSGRVAGDRDELIRQAKDTGRRIWIVFDGRDENVHEDGKVRISYTGGTGEHRADKFICDFVRMAWYLGCADKVTVRTNDKDFMAQLRHIVARRR